MAKLQEFETIEETLKCLGCGAGVFELTRARFNYETREAFAFGHRCARCRRTFYTPDVTKRVVKELRPWWRAITQWFAVRP